MILAVCLMASLVVFSCKKSTTPSKDKEQEEQKEEEKEEEKAETKPFSKHTPI